MRSGVAASLLQVLGIEPNDSTTKTTMMRKRNKRDAPAEMVPSRNNKNESNGEALQAKNHKLAKELVRGASEFSDAFLTNGISRVNAALSNEKRPRMYRV